MKELKNLFRLSIIIAFVFFTISNTLFASVTIKYEVPKAGRVSLAVYNTDGQLVRTLLTGKPHKAGQYIISWDGRDRYGKTCPASEYTWKLLSSIGLRAEFITQVGQNPDPAWEKGVGNHQPPDAAAVDASGVYRQGSVNEGAHWGVKTDLEGRYLWTNDHKKADPWIGGGEALTLVNGKLFELMRDGSVYGSDAKTGQVFTKSDIDPKPWNFRWNVFSAPTGVSDDMRRKLNAAQKPNDLCGDEKNNLLVASYPQHNAIAWFDANTGALIDSVNNITNLVAVAASKDGMVFAIANGAVVSLSRTNKNPRIIIAAEKLLGPWRLCISPKTGDIIIAENSDLALGKIEKAIPELSKVMAPDLAAGVKIVTPAGKRHHQVRRFSASGELLKTYGKPEGRIDGVYIPTDFKWITDIEADIEGGFVVTEGNQTPPRRTARFNADGKLLREWYGAQHYGVIVGPEPNDPTHVWFVGNADKPALIRCEVDCTNKTWKVLEIYQDVFAKNPYSQMPPIPTLFTYNAHIYIQGGGVQPIGLSLSVYDPVAKTLRPCNASGERNNKNYIWSDKNDDGLASDDELEWLNRNRVGGYVNPSNLDLMTTANATGFQAGIILSASKITDKGTPIYSGLNSKKYEPWVENGIANYPFDFRQDADGNWLACFSNSITNPKEATENHGAWYYNSCSAIDRLVKWDKNWKPIWSVGRHSSDNDHETGSTAMPRGLVGLAHGCVIWADASDEEVARPTVWTEDGLYVDELLRIPVDKMRKELYGADNTNEYPTGHITTDPKTGDTYYFAISSTGGAPIYKITGWDGWNHASGTITLPEADQKIAKLDGTGLKAEFFNGVSFEGTPIQSQVDELVSYHWLNGMDSLPSGINRESFSCRWSGQVEAPTSEKYRFVLEIMTPWRGGGWGKTGIPKRVKLWVGGSLLIDTDAGIYKTASFLPPGTKVDKNGNMIWDIDVFTDDITGNDQALYGEVMLQAGKRYDLCLECTYKGNAVAKLCWETPDLDRRVITTEFLHPTMGAKSEIQTPVEKRPDLLAEFDFEKNENVLWSKVGGDVFGRLTGNTSIVKGKSGNGIQFKGNGKYDAALFPIDEELRLPDTNYSLVFWFKTTDQNARLCEAKRYSSYNNVFADHIVSIEKGKICFKLIEDAALKTADSYNDGKWHQVVTTVEDGGQKLYVDGKLIATGKLNKRKKTSGRLGLDLGPGEENAVVSMDELRVYNRPITENDIQHLYKQ